MATTVAQDTARMRGETTDELARRYMELKDREAELSFDTEMFYMDVDNLLGRFSSTSLGEKLGLSRDAIYQWARKGRAARRRMNGHSQNQK